MVCSHCGKHVSPIAHYCPEDGRPIQEPAKKPRIEPAAQEYLARFTKDGQCLGKSIHRAIWAIGPQYAAGDNINFCIICGAELTPDS